MKKEDKTQTLQPNYYSFNFRRYKVQYLILFNDFKNAELLLRELLQDELSYYSNNQIKNNNTDHEQFDEEKLKKLEQYGLLSMVDEMRAKLNRNLSKSVDFE